MRFSKWQGLGNDYIILHERELPWELTAERVQLLCDRDFGIGADGIMLVGPPSGKDRFPVRIFNMDGSEAEMCGNGVRQAGRLQRRRGRGTHRCRRPQLHVHLRRRGQSPLRDHLALAA